MARLEIDSKDLDPIQLKTYKAIKRVAVEKAVRFIIVGASARDLVMHHAYGAPIQRATLDIDLAVQVPDWASFESIGDSLIHEGYTKTNLPHRLQGPHGAPIDILPFGSVESGDSIIAWPPSGDVQMSVVGFQDALDNADWLTVNTELKLELPVASPQGLTLLKLVAWSERDARTRRKDAADIAYLASNYENIPGQMERLYEQHEAVLELHGWDTRLAGAHVLGTEIADIACDSTTAFLQRLLDDDLVANLVRDSGSSYGDATTDIINALLVGLFGSEVTDVQN
ncbi:nucleotidyl transferase AbiEii/AbiGii toxin family protein [Marinobacter salarius]|jgi:predicted nucleotidyltransferase|uniref:nucleotidyl transferase AbiEii/AbiGii toxin family protein n=1 Tax=Marinobacter salarius TaxID=1420917 RepID=UPI0018F25F7B|nr:nucleotidyl transferase AbiEii/AbiGii toxin family protein [Marinobacter salarius]MBJ7275733.1 nucleotidyl transferase AbiEii/AbiGii toxin family protein [Marinobacter salarius]